MWRLLSSRRQSPRFAGRERPHELEKWDLQGVRIGFCEFEFHGTFVSRGYEQEYTALKQHDVRLIPTGPGLVGDVDHAW